MPQPADRARIGRSPTRLEPGVSHPSRLRLSLICTRVCGVLALAMTLAAVAPRLLGGLAVLRQRDRLHVAMGFAGGALVGVAAFGTLPEALELVPSPVVVLLALVGAGAFVTLDRTLLGHLHSEDAACNPHAGYVGAGGITAHAFLDGLAIGTAFQASTEIGILVSVAVLLHAFADGLNTVTVILRHDGRRKVALRWLAADAIVPLLGAALGLLIGLPDVVLGGALAIFAGMFVFMGAGSLLPAAHRRNRDRGLVWASAGAGFALALLATRLG